MHTILLVAFDKYLLIHPDTYSQDNTRSSTSWDPLPRPLQDGHWVQDIDSDFSHSNQIRCPGSYYID